MLTGREWLCDGRFLAFGYVLIVLAAVVLGGVIATVGDRSDRRAPVDTIAINQVHLSTFAISRSPSCPTRHKKEPELFSKSSSFVEFARAKYCPR
ncbi:MAG: hypothetical protein ACFCBU_04865 [Cyanophyceae cyanobacterium]